jgi:hypothetical protein
MPSQSGGCTRCVCNLLAAGYIGHLVVTRFFLRLVVMLAYTHCRDLIKSVPNCDRKVAIIHVIVDGQ